VSQALLIHILFGYLSDFETEFESNRVCLLWPYGVDSCEEKKPEAKNLVLILISVFKRAILFISLYSLKRRKNT
jgi:hypothetical protein